MSIPVTFKLHRRVTVTNPDPNHEPLRGKSGTVSRLRMADSAAWVDMDELLPLDLQSFPAFDPVGQPEGRHKHIILWPDECGVDPENDKPTSIQTQPEAKT